MIEQQELRWVQEDLEFGRVLLEEIGELLPGPLLAECDLSGARSVLEIGCGGGEWLRALARRYPDLRCVGIEQDEHLVRVANALAYRDGLPHAAILALDLSDVTPALFPDISFDLVHLSFLGRYILTADTRSLPGRALPCVDRAGWCAGRKPNCRARPAQPSSG